MGRRMKNEVGHGMGFMSHLGMVKEHGVKQVLADKEVAFLPQGTQHAHQLP